MKEGWIRKVLKEATTFKSGKTVSKDIEKPYGEILYTKVGDMNLKGNELNITTSSRFVNQQDIADNQIIPIGSIIFPKRGGAIATNKKRRIVKPTIVDLNTMAISPSKELLSDYLFYFIKSIDLSELSNGANVPQINNGSFDNVYIHYPKSLLEQKAIVKILDEAFAKIDQAKANIEKNIENAKELFQSKLNEIFSQRGEGIIMKRLDEFCEVKDGTHDSPKYVDEKEGIPFVTQKNILEYGISFEKTKFISQHDHDHFYKRSNVALNDILIAMIGANRGMACIVDDDRIFSIKNVGLIKKNDSYIPEYILYYLKSPISKKYIKENSSGSAQGFIGLGKLRSFPVPFMSIEAQKEIKETISTIDSSQKKLVKYYSEKLSNIEEFRKSILHKAFSGELV